MCAMKYANNIRGKIMNDFKDIKVRNSFRAEVISCKLEIPVIIIINIGENNE